MLFRFLVFTSLIVAFVAYLGTFGIQLAPSGDLTAQLASRNLRLAVLDDDGR